MREKVKNFMLKNAEAKTSIQIMPPLPQEVDDYDGVEEMDYEPNNKSQSEKLRLKCPIERFVTSAPLNILQRRKDKSFFFGIVINN